MPAETRPWFPFYVDDWLSSGAVGVMTSEARGAYAILLCYCWRDGGVPADDASLAALARLTPKRWDSIKASVLRALTPTEHGYISERLEVERLREGARSKHDSARARTAAQARWGARRSDAPSMPGAMPNACLDDARDMPCQMSDVRDHKEQEQGRSAVADAPAPDMPPEPAPFVDFWDLWPAGYRVGRKQAVEQWRKLAPGDRATALEALVWRVEHDHRWQGPADDGRWGIPHPFRWLRDRRFEDARAAPQVMRAAPRTTAAPMPSYNPDWCQHEPRCASRDWHDLMVAREAKAEVTT